MIWAGILWGVKPLLLLGVVKPSSHWPLQHILVPTCSVVLQSTPPSTLHPSALGIHQVAACSVKTLPFLSPGWCLAVAPTPSGESWWGSVAALPGPWLLSLPCTWATAVWGQWDVGAGATFPFGRPQKESRIGLPGSECSPPLPFIETQTASNSCFPLNVSALFQTRKQDQSVNPKIKILRFMFSDSLIDFPLRQRAPY